MYTPFITQTIAEEHVRDLERLAADSRAVRLARQRRSRLRRSGQEAAPAALRLLPAIIRPRFS